MFEFVRENPAISVFILILAFIVIMNVMSYTHGVLVAFINRNKTVVNNYECNHDHDDDADEDDDD